MLLESDTTRLHEAVGKIVPTEFEIADAGMMIEHMVTNIYKNKKRVVVQEIASNARDAHREVGAPNLPIIIKLPNRFSSTLEFRDFGPGMDPNRIQKIFTKVGASTKRDDNKQTGGFGIGAKTPWAYTDTFTIRTIAMENGDLVSRTYSAIHGDKTFTLMEMGDAITIDKADPLVPEEDKRTGTTIIINVSDKDDFRYFADYTLQVTQWWDVRPIIKGMDPLPVWTEMKTLYEGVNWKVLPYDRRNYVTHTLCVDGIPYPLDVNALENCPNHLRTLTQCGLVLFFNVGELSVALNREELQYTPKTRAAVIARLEEIYKELQAQIAAEIAKADSFLNAKLAFRKMVAALQVSIVKNVLWRGVMIDGEDISLNSGEVRTYVKHQTVGGLKLKQHKGCKINLTENTLFVHNDCNSHSPLKVWTLFDQNPTVTSVQIITFQWNMSTPAGVADKAKWVKDNNWDLLNVISFATVPKKKAAKAAPGPKLPKNTVRAATYCGVGRNPWARDQAIDLTNGSGVYVVVSHGQAVGFNQHKINKAKKMMGLTDVFGIHERFVARLGSGWKSLSTIINDALTAEQKNVNVTDYATWHRYQDASLIKENRTLNAIMEIIIEENLIEDKSCILITWFNMNKEVEALKVKADIVTAQIGRFTELAELINEYGKVEFEKNAVINTEWENIEARCLAAFPLLTISTQHYYNDMQKYAREFGFYINARQKENSLTITPVLV